MRPTLLTAPEPSTCRVPCNVMPSPLSRTSVKTRLPRPHPSTVPVKTWTPVPTNPVLVGVPAPPEIEVPSKAPLNRDPAHPYPACRPRMRRVDDHGPRHLSAP